MAPSLARCSRSRTTTKDQLCALPADGARIAASRIFVSTSCGTGSGLSRRSARAVYMASNRAISLTVGVSIMSSRGRAETARRVLALHQCQRSAGVNLGAIHDVLFVGVIVDAGRERGLGSIAGGGHSKLAPTSRITAGEPHDKLWLFTADNLRRSAECHHQWIVERGPIGVPCLDRLEFNIVCGLFSDHLLAFLRGDPWGEPDVDLRARARCHLAAHRAGRNCPCIE